MRYKIARMVLVLLIATPVYSQEKSYIVVETPRTTVPTVVKTGEPFTQEYIVRFIDMTELGEEVAIQEDGLRSGILGNFEVLGFDIDKSTEQKEFLEHVWRLTYTLRIINPKKDNYKIPPITIPWVLKEIGQDITDPSLKVNTDFKTEEVYVSYVSTITKDPYLDIRDEVDFGSFYRTALVYRSLSWLFMIIPMVFAVVSLRRISLLMSPKVNKAVEPENNAGGVVIIATQVSAKKALKNLRRSLGKLEDFAGGNHAIGFRKVAEELTISIMAYLRIEVDESGPGTTPMEMVKLLNTSKYAKGSKGKALLALSLKANTYQLILERESSPHYPHDMPINEVLSLRKTLKNLNWYSVLVNYIKDTFRRRSGG